MKISDLQIVNDIHASTNTSLLDVDATVTRYTHEIAAKNNEIHALQQKVHQLDSSNQECRAQAQSRVIDLTTTIDQANRIIELESEIHAVELSHSLALEELERTRAEAKSQVSATSEARRLRDEQSRQSGEWLKAKIQEWKLHLNLKSGTDTDKAM